MRAPAAPAATTSRDPEQTMGSRQALKKVIPVEDAVSVLQDGEVLATSGYGGHGMPEQLLVALEQRFLATGRPREEI